MQLSDNARTIMDLRYSRKDSDGNPTETPYQVVERVAANVAIVNALHENNPSKDSIIIHPDQFPFKTAQRAYNYYADQPGWGPLGFNTQIARGYKAYQDQAVKYRQILEHRYFFPNSPTWTGAGTPLGQLAACFVLPVDDDLGRTRTSIFETLKVAALIQQTGGGNGFDFSRLRPSDSIVKTSMGRASGPVGFMEAYDASFIIIAQGGSRRGANMGVLRCDHPDIFGFVKAKTEEGKIAGFNISVAITDKFMHAVDRDDKFDLVWGGKVFTTIFARELFDKLTEDAWKLGDPGCLFIDRANRDNPCPTRYKLEATNPCVTADTWTMTQSGPRRVRDLVGMRTHLTIGGGHYKSSGFFPTKDADVFEVRTREGWRAKMTADHKVLTTHGWVEAGQLEPGTEICLQLHGSNLKWRGAGSQQDGYLLGLLWGDGTISDQNGAILSTWDHDEGSPAMRCVAYDFLNEYPHRSDWRGWMKVADRGEWRMVNKALSQLAEDFELVHGNKHIGDAIEMASSDFYRGFLRGAFDADGHVEGTSQSGGVSIRLSQSHLADLEAIQRMLGRLGILSRIYYSDRQDSGFGSGDQWRLVISGSMASDFMDRVGFTNTSKAEKWKKALEGSTRGFYKPTVTASVKEIVYVGHEQTYDVQVSSVHSFDANGLYVHNCGEQWLPPYGTCTLGSIAVQRFASWDKSTDTKTLFDWDQLAIVVRTATQFLDDVVDANQYVRGVPEVAEMAHNERRIGLGLMGVADAMAMMGIRYGTLEAQEFLGILTEFCRYHCMLASIERAKNRGSFPWIKNSIYDPMLLREFGEGAKIGPEFVAETFKLWERPTEWPDSSFSFGRPEIEWDRVLDGLQAHGIRNACQFNFAPTGTISNVADCEGSGLEPFFAIVFERKVVQEGRNIVLKYASPLFREALVRAGLNEVAINNIIEMVKANNGSCQGIEFVPQQVRDAFVVASDVLPEDHVAMQAAAQVFTDNSISKTINFPNDATVEDVAKVYKQAWRSGCKGITIYRQGSRQYEILTTGPSGGLERSPESEFPSAEVNVMREEWPIIHPIPLPPTARTHGISARVFPVSTAFGTLQVTITEHPKYPGRPFDVRASVGKGGSDKNADVEAIGRTISLATRAGVAVEDVVDQLIGVGGRTFSGFGPNRSHSVADAIGKLLKRVYMDEPDEDFEEEEDTKVTAPPIIDLSMVCPECHNATVVNESGCRHCDIRIGGCGRYNACD